MDTATLDPISSVRGKLFKADDILIWTPQKFEEFFTFLEFFWDEGKMIVKQDTILMLEEYSASGSSCAEFMARIDMPITEGIEMKMPDKQKFRLRLGTMYRMVKKYLESVNPGALSPLTAKKCRFKPQYEWMRTLYKDDGTIKYNPQKFDEDFDENEVNERSQSTEIETVQPTALISDLPLNQRLINAIDKVINVYEAIAGSITMEEIQKLPLKEKIAALNKLSYIHAATGKSKLPPGRITQINFNTAGKEDLEKAMLAMGDDDDDTI